MKTAPALIAWLAIAAAPCLSAADANKGKSTFQQRCASCHSADSNVRKMGPTLKGLFARPKLASGQATSEPNVRAAVNQGGRGMPAYKTLLTEPMKDDLLAYLKSL